MRVASGATKRGVQIIVKPTLKQVRARNQRRLKELRKTKNPNQKVAVFLDQWVQDNFKSEGGKVGGWAPLKAGGRRVKGVFDSTAKILQDTGRLRISFLPFASKTNAGIGSDIPYAKKHEEGEGALPVRRMLPKKAEVLRTIRALYNGHIKRTFKR